MTQLTVRGIEGDLHRLLKEKAVANGMSVNKYLVDLIRRDVGLKKGGEKKVVHNDLDHLAGTWSDEEFEEFEENMQWVRKIDAELWE